MTIKALGHRILLKPEQEEKTDWGFALDVGDTYKMELAATEVGVVVDIGPNAFKAFDEGEPWVKVGDSVIFAKHAGKMVKHKDEVYFVINDDDLQVRIEEEEDA